MTSEPIDAGPYAGRRVFGSHDRAWFHGRDHEARFIAATWLEQPITVLHGPAGIGKTSLLHAGVLPRLQGHDAVVLPVGRMDRAFPFPSAALPEDDPRLFTLLSSWSPVTAPSALYGRTISDFVRRMTRRARNGESLPLLIAIDQSDAVCRLSDSTFHRKRFLYELATAVREHEWVRLLVSVRSEHLPRVLATAKKHLDHRVAEVGLGGLEVGAAVDAVTGPPRSRGRIITPQAARALVDSVSGRDMRVEPVLLQALCTQLWLGWPTGLTHLDENSFDPKNLVDHALTGFCREVLHEVAATHTWILPGKDRTEQLANIQRRLGTGDAAVLPRPVRHALVDAHLLRTAGGDRYELLSPVLMRALHRQNLSARPLDTPSAPVFLKAAEVSSFNEENALASRQAEEALTSRANDSIRILADARLLLGNIAYAAGHLDQAFHHYELAARFFEAVGEFRSVVYSLTACGRIRLHEGRQAEAEARLRSAITRAPEDPIVQAGLGQILFYAGRVDQALSVFDRILSGQGDSPSVRQARGEIMVDRGDAEAALREFERVDRLADPAARSARALALAMLHHFEAAKKELGDLDQAEDNGSVLLRSALVEELCEDLAAAAELAERALAANHPPLPAHRRADARRLVGIGVPWKPAQNSSRSAADPR